jgi:2-keto-4-pentenoate hydratase
MTIAATDTAARYLVAARLAGRPGARLPEACRPADVEAALGIQQRVTELLALAIGGWKCSVPSAERPIAAAPIYAPNVVATSPCPILPIGDQARVEPEVAFIIGRDLPHRDTLYTEAEVRAAIREPHLVLELIGPRYADAAAVSYTELLADGIANQGLFVGPAVPGALDQPLDAMPIAVDAPDRRLHAAQGRHPDGHPLKPLLWLVNFLARRGEGLTAGQIVTTGSYCGVLDVPLKTPLTVRYGELGTLSVRFESV